MIAEESVAGLLQLMSAAEPGPAAGSAAALTAGLAAALLGKTARLSGEYLDDAGALATAADTLREQAQQLATDDAEGVRAMLSGDTDPTGQPDPSATPRRIGELATDIAGLATHLATYGNPTLLADAHTAGHLARAARAGTEAIIRSNQGR
ncbi:MAG TPA: hypothetical protein VK095_00865 [Beutenbergiaceae bacterium]|nr:hypothetical protein [Beutenbergiaceae bacterium]